MSDPFTIMSGVGSLMGGLAGLFGSRRKNPSPRDNIMSQAAGAREAAAAYGFNPLTMLQYGNPGGTGLGNSGPPLASFQMIADGFREIGDVTSGDAERRRQQENLKLDLAKLEIERLKAGNASDALGGVSPLGNRAVNVTSPGQFQPARVVSNPDRTSVQVAGVHTKPDMGWSDAEEIEKRYGDVASWAYGLGVAGADASSTIPASVNEAGEAVFPDMEKMPIRERPPRYWSRNYGAVPSGFTADDRPFWPDGRGITFTPPNKRKVQ